jgi:hypothetical protein
VRRTLILCALAALAASCGRQTAQPIKAAPPPPPRLSIDAITRAIPERVKDRRAWAQANEDTLLRVLRTLGQAHRWLYDPENREEAIAILVAVLQAEPDEARDAKLDELVGSSVRSAGQRSTASSRAKRRAIPRRSRPG